MALTKVTYAMIEDAPVNVDDYGADPTGVADSAAAIQLALTNNPGQTLVFSGTYKITTSLTVASNNTALVFRNGAGLTYATATLKALVIDGDNVVVENMKLTGPATFDATNVQPTYAGVWVTGDNCSLTGLHLVNVPKIGVMFSECNEGYVSGIRVEGNFPSASFTGTETGHAAVLIDAPSTGRQGSFRIIGCNISTCVQGVLIANYGAASRSQGIVVSDNVFYSCWNHGVYASGSVNNGVVVDGNSFVFCQVPVALAGSYHTVVGNSITTGGSSGAYTDIVGISMRDPEQCVVANNVIQGETGTGQSVIALTLNSGTTARKNVVSGNTVNITGSGSSIIINVGGATATDLTDNIIVGNVCSGTGVTSTGIIAVSGNTACIAYGTIVSDNTIIAKSASYGVIVGNCTGVSVSNNKYRLEFDAGSAATVAAVRLGVAVGCDVANNTCTVTASWGTNITVYGVWEGTGSSGNYARNNTFRVDLTKVAAATHYNTSSTSGIIVQDVGSGAPNLNAGVGSTWGRTDGGASTSLYVKESGTGATGWVGK